MNVNVVFNDAYTPFFTSQKRFAVLFGSAGSGKSVAAAQKLIGRCVQEPNTRHLVVRKYRSSIKESVFKLIKDIISQIGLSDFVRVNNTDMSFYFANGSEIVTSGLDDVEKLKSIHEIVSIWVEEATEIGKLDFTQLNLRLRGSSGKYKQIVMTLNPISELHWIKTDIYDKKDDRIFTMRTTYKDNNFLDDQYKTELEERYKDDPNTYRVYVLGEWGKVVTGTEFYSGFNYSKHVVDQIHPYTKEHFHLAYDFNARPYMPALVAQIVRIENEDQTIDWEVNILDEIAMYNPHNTTEDCTDEFLLRYEELIYPPVYIYGDASGYSSNPLNNLHNYEVIEAVLGGFTNKNAIRVPRSNPSILKRRQFINKILNGGYNIKVRVSKKCKLFIEDLENVQEDVDGKKAKKVTRDRETGSAYQKYGHFSDAFDYLLCEAFRGYYDNFQAIVDR